MPRSWYMGRFMNGKQVTILAAAITTIGALSTAACGDDSASNGGAGGGSTGSTTNTGSTGTTMTSSSTGGFPCSPSASCMAPDKDCIGLVDNTAAMKPGLRIAQLTVAK